MSLIEGCPRHSGGVAPSQEAIDHLARIADRSVTTYHEREVASRPYFRALEKARLKAEAEKTESEQSYKSSETLERF